MAAPMTNTGRIKSRSLKLERTHLGRVCGAYRQQCWLLRSSLSHLSLRWVLVFSARGLFFLACCECGAEGSLGFTRLTIWNGALFNVAYAETSWLWDPSHSPSPRCSFSQTCVFFYVQDRPVRYVTNFKEFKLCLLRLGTFNKSWLICWDSVWSRSVDVSRDRSLPRRFRFLNCSTGYGPEKQSNVSSSPRFLHIIPVSLWLQAAHSHLSLPPSQIHFASLRAKTILWYHFTDSEHVT